LNKQLIKWKLSDTSHNEFVKAKMIAQISYGIIRFSGLGEGAIAWCP